MSDLKEHALVENNIPPRETPKNMDTNVLKYGWHRWNSWFGFRQNIKNIPNVIKMAWHRITRGYCAYDTFDLDISYVNYLLSTLIYFRNHTNSYPLKFNTHEDWVA
jgi:hypothetical protein